MLWKEPNETKHLINWENFVWTSFEAKITATCSEIQYNTLM